MSDLNPALVDLDVSEPGELLEGPATIRSLTEADAAAIIAMDAKEIGHPRREYYEEKIARCIRDPGLNTSLVAEVDGLPVGFLIGRLFFGEFGLPFTRAVLDTLGVHPAFRGRSIGRALLEQFGKNMKGLRVEAIDTLVEWDRFGLLTFFRSLGFRPSRDVDLVWDLKRYPFRAREAECTVRSAQEPDLAKLESLERELLGSARKRYLAAKLHAAEAHPTRNRILVAEIGNEIAGYLVAAVYQGEFGIDLTRGVVEAIAVRDRFEHRGVASGLLQQLLSWLTEQKAGEVETLCHWNEWGLLRFFEYVGFRPAARLNLEWRLT